ncbi:hypothetical protein NPIL_472761 [Nephila pilipes]|uniref:Uncharacterized protein n=1 Tax=Nephila pilipes TaxID=299642 RepID=A0A8X6QU45_NEPPI|nr:hypothetical protein NPIL_472761 [Nephila pilipes]
MADAGCPGITLFTHQTPAHGAGADKAPTGGADERAAPADPEMYGGSRCRQRPPPGYSGAEVRKRVRLVDIMAPKRRDMVSAELCGARGDYADECAGSGYVPRVIGTDDPSGLHHSSTTKRNGAGAEQPSYEPVPSDGAAPMT